MITVTARTYPEQEALMTALDETGLHIVDIREDDFLIESHPALEDGFRNTYVEECVRRQVTPLTRVW